MTPKIFWDTILTNKITLKKFHTFARTLARCIKKKNFPDQKFLAQNSKKMTLFLDIRCAPSFIRGAGRMQHAPRHHETTCMGLRYPPLKYYGHRPPSGQTRDLLQLRVVGRGSKKNSYIIRKSYVAQNPALLPTDPPTLSWLSSFWWILYLQIFRKSSEEKKFCVHQRGGSEISAWKLG